MESKTAEVIAMDQVYDAGKAVADQIQERAEAIGWDNRNIGRIEMSRHFSEYAEMVTYLHLYHIQKTKEYKNDGLTFNDVLEQAGIPRRTAYRNLEQIRQIVEKVNGQMQRLIGFDFNQIRQINKLMDQGAAEINDNMLLIGSESIELTPENRESIEEALNRLAIQHDEERARLKKEINTQKRRTNTIIKEETKSLSQERDSLVAEVSRLKQLLPDDDLAMAWSDEKLNDVVAAAAQFCAMVRKLANTPDAGIETDRILQGRISGVMDSVEGMFADLRRDFESRIRTGDEMSEI